MRVVLVTSIARGGPVEHALSLASGLRREGVTVTAVCGHQQLATRFSDAGADAVVIPLRHQADWRGARRVWRSYRGADVVHAHDRRSGLWVRLGPRPRTDGLRVYTAHGLPEPYLPAPARPGPPGVRAWLAYRQLDARLSRRADAVVVPSQAARLAFAELGFPVEKLHVIANGVPADIEPSARAGELVGTVCELDPVKGLEVFLRCAAVLSRGRPELRFAIFGEGLQREALERLARELGISDRLALPGYVPAPEALGRLRVFVLSSYMETSGIALMEAMAAGVPAVATRVGGIPELAAEGTAQLVDVGDVNGTAAAIGRLLDDEPLAQRQADAARTRVRAKFTTEQTAHNMLELYGELLRQRRCASS